MPGVCPDRPQLQFFLLGQVTQDEAETLERHLEQCAGCRQSLDTLDDTDGLLQAARAIAGRPALTPPVRIARLVDELARLSLSETQSEPATGGDAEGAAHVSLASLLAPPQQLDEIGRLGGYRVLGVLKSGGMGIVFRAEDPQLGRLVALKVIKPSLLAHRTARQRFLREARAAAAMEHDHIVPIYQVGEDRGIPFLAFPLLKGETLEERLHREPKLPIPEILRIGREIAEGLAAAHARGMIHRDIKPANIWLEAVGRRVKILDFGLARVVVDVQESIQESDASFPLAERPRGSAALTHAGAIVGTPAYMAPEQARSGTVDSRADLFSLGAVLYRMATGRGAFSGRDAAAVLVSLERDRPVPPRTLNRQVPVRLSRLIQQLLARDAADRPVSAKAVAERLTAITQHGRQRWWAILAAGMLAALVLMLAYELVPQRHDEVDPADVALAGVEFTVAASYDTGMNPRMMAVGDLNGDGNLDLVVANMGVRSSKFEEHTKSTVSVLLGNADGTFQPAVHYPAGKQPAGVHVGDLNRDGKADIVVANCSSHDVSVLLGKGDGTFQPAIHYPAGRHPVEVAAADLNGDGMLDLAVGNFFHQGSVSVLLGNGDGSFRPPITHATGVNSPRLVAADLNGDGRPDLAVSNASSDTVSVLLGNGDGTFRPLPHRIGLPTVVGVADFDGDGKLDLAVASNRPPGVHLLLGRGDGTFRVGAKVGGEDRTVVELRTLVADFNGDGRADLIALDSLGPDHCKLHLHLGTGRGHFQSSPAQRLGFRPMSLTAGDFNRDGRPDLAVTVDGTDKVWVLLNRSVVQRLTVSNHEFRVDEGTFVLVTAQDAAGGTAIGYTGTVRIHCDGEPKGLPAEYTFTVRDQGAHPFNPVFFAQPGQYTVSVTDTANPALAATGTVKVLPRQP